jgi:hypothetical protein
MEKSPLDLLKEQEELAAYISSKTKQSLITPENNISIRLECSQALLQCKYYLRAHFEFNGRTGFVESEIHRIDLEAAKKDISSSSDSVLEVVKFFTAELSQKLSERLTDLLQEEMTVACVRDLCELITSKKTSNSVLAR